ncbi:MAG: hypothetical protein IPI57_16380 [Candidatus Competibacteraceae bacterium]|nr:hypothetical protein [Candidatus Competibacteraceae bacterium]
MAVSAAIMPLCDAVRIIALNRRSSSNYCKSFGSFTSTPMFAKTVFDRPRGGPVDERPFARPDMIRQRPLQVGDIDFDRADRAGQQQSAPRLIDLPSGAFPAVRRARLFLPRCVGYLDRHPSVCPQKRPQFGDVFS